MSSAAEKANLARIRDNQRRSRARRKEYLQELENRVRQCELKGIEASSEIQVAARRVADENRKLRLLLNQSGIFDDEIEHHLSSTSLPDGAGGAGQAVALLEELLQPRKPCGAGTHSFMGSLLGAAGEHGTGTSRDSSVGSMSTSQSSIWDQPMASVHSSSEHKRHRNAHSQIHSHTSSVSAATQPGAKTTSVGINQPKNRNSPISQRGGHMLAPNRNRPPNVQIQSPSNMSPTNTSINPSPIFDPQTFDFDTQSSDPFDSNNLYFHTHTSFDQFPRAPPPQNSSANLIPQTLQPQPQSQPPSRSNPPNARSYSVHNSGSDQNKSRFESTLMNTSSCLFATDMIRTMTGGKDEDVRAELGCGDGEEDCDVSDETVFGVMGRYS